MQIRLAHVFIIFIVLFLSDSIVAANEVQVRFMGVETDRGDLYLKQGDDFVRMSVPLYQSSVYYQAETDGSSLQLYMRIENPEGLPFYEVFVAGRLPTGAQSALGIYIIAADGQPRLYFYDDDWSKFPKQSYRLINISPVAVSSKIENSLVTVQPFQADIVKVNIKSNLPLVRVMTAYKGGDNKWKPIFNQRTPLLPDWRITGIAVVTNGLLDKAMSVPSMVEPTSAGKARLSFFNFKDNSATSSQKVAENQASARSGELR
jgi:hypothetical protein